MKEFEFETGYGYNLFGNKWEIDNPKEIVVIITGMAEHSARYDHFATFLNRHGFSVYCIDHHGQGKNTPLGRPGEDYFAKEIEIYNHLIIDLREKYNLKVNVFAHSMGSFITQGLIEKYSYNIDRTILCGSNGRNGLVKIGYLLAKIIVNDKNKDKDANLLYKLSIGAYEKTIEKGESINSWISYNKENVKVYDEDPLSGFKCSNGFYKEFFKGLTTIQKTKNIKKINPKMPIFIIGGDKDPVGNNGKGLVNLYNLYKKNGLNVKLCIYKNMKHEILNEENKMIVYNDIVLFLKDRYEEK